jgi:hypothetical protein
MSVRTPVPLFARLALLAAMLACTISSAGKLPVPTVTPEQPAVVTRGAGVALKLPDKWTSQGDGSRLVLSLAPVDLQAQVPSGWRITIVLLDESALLDPDKVLADIVYPDADAPGELISAAEQVRVGNARGVAHTMLVTEHGQTFVRRTIVARTAAHTYRIEIESPEALWGSFQDSFETLSAGFQFS